MRGHRHGVHRLRPEVKEGVQFTAAWLVDAGWQMTTAVSSRIYSTRVVLPPLDPLARATNLRPHTRSCDGSQRRDSPADHSAEPLFWNQAKLPT